jgi:hypothetical protein
MLKHPRTYALIRVEPQTWPWSAYPDYLLPFDWLTDKSRRLIIDGVTTAEPVAYAADVERMNDYPVHFLGPNVNKPFAQDLEQMHAIVNDLYTLVDEGLLSQQHAEQTLGWGL